MNIDRDFFVMNCRKLLKITGKGNLMALNRVVLSKMNKHNILWSVSCVKQDSERFSMKILYFLLSLRM